jgi:hypothetical protein
MIDAMRDKLADNVKLTHLALTEPKTVGNSDLRNREKNGAGCKPQQRIPLEAPRSKSGVPRLMFLAES